ncbi:MAG: FAD-binding oxidoreductase [Alphaproteobacteria bacterium]|nr:FAD-binding oxidoreductase [Alphaproteobacteria bacterium]
MKVDVAILGGGAVGSAIAWFLRREGFVGSVVVVERDPTYARASSALSASSIRQQFSTPLNIHLSRFGIGFLRKAAALLGTDLALREPGYLFLASAAGETVLRASHAVQRAEDCAVALLDPTALRARFPWLSTDGVALASLGTANEGWFDGPGLLQALRRGARGLGAEYLADEVVALSSDARRIDLASGAELVAAKTVIACGGWSGAVSALAGISLPVEPRRRTVFVVDARGAPRDMPLTIDTTGVWVRPEGRFWLAGTSPDETDDPREPPLEPRHQEWDDTVWPVIAARVPAFEAAKVVNSWAGYYDYNTFDQNGIVGPHPELPNLLFATGFSGHGIQQSPAVGRAVAEWLVHGRYRSLDLAAFGYDRIPAGRPVRELAVV